MLADWSHTPLDQFILAGLKKKGLSPAPPADRLTLLRRLCFDLTGLPPSPADVDTFENDDRPDAVARLVDRLLASPAYGERWAQHWLDLARFAETDGFEHDKTRPNAWRYRDWVVDAWNRDLPYDQFLSQQLAGDELYPDDDGARQATAFCLSGPDMPDINSQDERRHVLLNELTATVGSVFLGLQVGCAQCHDHKYDPISQGDFYRLRACFEPAVALKKDQLVSLLDTSPAAEVQSRLYVRGDWRTPGPAVSPAFPRIANAAGIPFPPESVTKAVGRRAALSRWLTRPDHPLTARVLANRLWQFHFGRGLSETPSDFGLLGDEPLHAELLDWLACELVDGQWSMKHLHRLILTSSVYAQSVHGDQASLRADPHNRYCSRFQRRRLSGEELRDALFSASQVLNRRQGGRGVMPPLPTELSQTLLKNQWTVSPDPAEHYRRSIYVFARRNLRYPIFDVFDRPDANGSCPDRNRSTTAPQSLHLLNSQLSLDAARKLAGSLLQETTDERQLVLHAVRRVLSRFPTAAEQQKLIAFLQQQRELLAAENRHAATMASPDPMPPDLDSAAGAALVDLCLALFNLSEFVYVE
ncbi:MAG: DUF1549 and DUF1553 domain-containing protein [Pirellulaceae bacterium]